MRPKAWIRLGAGVTLLAAGLWSWLSLAPTATPAQVPAQAPPDRPACTVLRVIDGDSIECGIDGAKASIRLLGIDAPELRQRPYGARSAAALRALLPHRSVARLELDVRERDQYGRILAHVWNEDSVLVNEQMLRQGFAVVYILPPNVKYASEFRSASRSAQEDKRGLWATSAFDCSPADYRQKRCE